MVVQSIVLGIVLSLLFLELTHHSPGGIIVPGYLALGLSNFWAFAGTLGIALLSYLALILLCRYWILFGRRRFATALLIGIALKIVFVETSLLPAFFSWQLDSIGYLIPGLIATDCFRQGVSRTLLALLVVTLTTFLILRVVF